MNPRSDAPAAEAAVEPGTARAADTGTATRPLTVIQLRIIRFIEEFTTRHGFSPTGREIGDEVGLRSTSSVAYQISVLQGRGVIRRDAAASRCAPRRITVAGRRRISVDAEDVQLVLGVDATGATVAQRAAAQRLWRALGEGQ